MSHRAAEPQPRFGASCACRADHRKRWSAPRKSSWVSAKRRSANASICSGKVTCARHADIGVDKVPTLKQQRFVHRFSQCVSETIAEIQPGPMPSPPEVVVGLASQGALMQGYGFNDDGSSTQERFCLPGGTRPGLPFEDNIEFQVVHDTEAANVRRQNQAREVLGFRLFKQYGDQRGSIENHFGSPCSS